jgi:putative ABC transport system permease protein
MRWALSITVVGIAVAASIVYRLAPGALQASGTPAPSTAISSTIADGTPEVLLSRQLLERAGLRVGDIVTLATTPSGTRTAPFRIVAAYEPTPDPTHFTAKRLEARLHLPDLVALTSAPGDPQASESVSQLNVVLASPEDANPVKSAIAARAPGLSVRPTSRPSDGTDLFGVLDRFHQAIAVVTVVGSTAFLLALMLMRAEERREIVGSLRLIGISSRTILGEVFFEGLLIALAGGLLGIALAASAQGLVNRFFQWQYDTPLVFMRVTPSIAWRSVAFGVPLGIFAGLAASWALLRRNVGALVRR